MQARVKAAAPSQRKMGATLSIAWGVRVTSARPKINEQAKRKASQQTPRVTRMETTRAVSDIGGASFIGADSVGGMSLGL